MRDGAVVTDYSKRAKSDQSLRGIKKRAKEDPVAAQRVADNVIRNTYRVLMTRGLKGCFVFCTDRALAEHLRSRRPSGSTREAYRLRDELDLPVAAEDPLEG